jgi:hypothetical protein
MYLAEHGVQLAPEKTLSDTSTVRLEALPLQREMCGRSLNLA